MHMNIHLIHINTHVNMLMTMPYIPISPNDVVQCMIKQSYCGHIVS